MPKPAHLIVPMPSILDKLEAFSSGAHEKISATAQHIETARRIADSTLKARSLRFCRNVFRDAANGFLLHPGIHGTAPCGLDLYEQALEQNKTEDAQENLMRTADSLRFAILDYMRQNSIHGSDLDLSAEESASLEMAFPKTCPKRDVLAL